MNASSRVWSSTRETPQGAHLAEELLEADTVLVTTPFAPTSLSGSTIDLAFASLDIAPRVTWDQVDTLVSDHIATQVTLNDALVPAVTAQRPRWALRRANWAVYTTHLELGSQGVHLTGDLDDDYTALSGAVQRAAEASIPRTSDRPPTRRTRHLPPEARKWTRLLSQTTKYYKHRKCNESLAELRDTQRDARHQLTLLREAAFGRWCADLESKSTTELFAILRRLQGSPGGAKVDDPLAEAERLTALFTTRANEATLPDQVKAAHDSQAPFYRQRIHDAEATEADTDTPFTDDELDVALHSAKSTSPGDDDLHYDFYRRAPTAFRRLFLELCNSSWRQRKLPIAWKRALVVPIPKPGGAGHRPISLLHCAGKIMERMVAARLRWVTPNIPLMFGFVPGRSTSDAITQVIGDISRRRGPKRRGKVVAVFLDLDKAFERALPLPVLDSLQRLGVRGTMLAWIEDYLSYRFARVDVQGHVSSLHLHTSGVPQGSVVSPLLFNALVATILSEAPTPATTRIVAYADDIAIVSAGPQPFGDAQRALDRIHRATSRAGLLISPAKTKAMYFHGQRKRATVLTLAGQPVEYVTQYKYLGVVIDSQLSFAPHADHLRRKLQRRINLTRLLGGTIDGATTTMMLQLYRALVHSCLVYGAPALLMAAPSTIDSLERLQRVALRVALGLPRHASSPLTLEEAGVLPLRLAVHDATARYLIRAALHPQPPPVIETVKSALPRDPDLFPPTTWALRAALVLRTREITTLPEPSLRATWPPWRPLPLRAHIDNTTPKTTDPEAAATAALQRIAIHESEGAWPLYTDASQLPQGNTSWAVASANTDTCGRLADHTPIALAEMTAIREALLSFEENPTDAPAVVVHTDSMAAVQILTSRRPRSYHRTVQETWDAASRLRRPVTLHWVPSHTGIPGNDRADALAATATRLPDIQDTETALGTFRPQLDKTAKDHTRRYISTRTGPALRAWYDRTTPDGQRRPPLRRRLDRQLRQLRTWSFAGSPWICRACDDVQSPVHYLVQCPAQPALRQRLLDALRPEEHQLPATDRAALILRRAAARPEALLRLLTTDPYGATWSGATT